jgi:protein-L-isoaspartate(D-aspartate) O-methyltransferase
LQLEGLHPRVGARVCVFVQIHLFEGGVRAEVDVELTALLSRLAADVVSIEMRPDLARQARGNLARQGVRNVELRVGDGSGGVPDRAPYDAVVVSGAFPEVPAPLIAQLRQSGRLVQPIGPGGHERVVCFVCKASGLEQRRMVTAARFVRLEGRYGFPRDDVDSP